MIHIFVLDNCIFLKSGQICVMSFSSPQLIPNATAGLSGSSSTDGRTKTTKQNTMDGETPG